MSIQHFFYSYYLILIFYLILLKYYYLYLFPPSDFVQRKLQILRFVALLRLLIWTGCVTEVFGVHLVGHPENSTTAGGIFSVYTPLKKKVHPLGYLLYGYIFPYVPFNNAYIIQIYVDINI